MNKRKIKRKNPYPATRKKKRPHVQYRALEKVAYEWEYVFEYFYLFNLKGEWWACQQSDHFNGHIEIWGEYYRKVFPVEFYDGGDGDIVIGHVSSVYTENMAIYKGRFVFVKNSFCPGYEFTRALAFKSEKHFEYYKKYEIWKTQHNDYPQPVHGTGRVRKKQTDFPAPPDIVS